MGSVEVERIVRDQCLEQIDSVLSHLSEAPLASILESNILDSGIAKYFLLSQFSIQYLLFCRKFLEETLADLRESHASAQMDVATLKRSLSEANNEILQLNKRVTQMEAIHEVIYPCHLCTKNFVSNDALNLHISRKHNNNKNVKYDLPTVKDRENDLSLINTIKLELEIKRLKERLNNAERKIKEGVEATSPSGTKNKCNSNTPTPIAPIATNSIGIQSNLTETKEQDEKKDESPHICQRAEQISNLHESLLDLSKWKEEQRHQSSECLAEINKKLKELTEVIEQQKQHRPDELPSTSKASIDELDAWLSLKVDEISELTFGKLNEVVKRMESNYKEKLETLETELLKKESKQTEAVQFIQPVKDTLEAVQESASDNITVKDESKQSQTQTVSYNKRFNEKCDGFETDSSLEEGSSSHSNHTFTKSQAQAQENKYDRGHDSDTDASGDVVRDRIKSPGRNNFRNNESSGRTTKDNTERNPYNDTKHRIIPPKPKTVTRKETRRLLKSRLIDLGIDKQVTNLTPTSMKVVAKELSERRHKLKEKYPNFYATRNKIKKFVDKLCSSKLPENARALLDATRPPKQVGNSLKQTEADFSISPDEENKNAEEKPKGYATSEFGLHSVHDPEFKQRLESILASPIRKPEESFKNNSSEENDIKAPVPLPRKKVVFSRSDINDTLSLSEAESPSFTKK
uniref:Uncharacterized protein n=1 Tax=Musca domestica TaxID=7370 RepID=A0A1I8MWR6_MUSDO